MQLRTIYSSGFLQGIYLVVQNAQIRRRLRSISYASVPERNFLFLLTILAADS